MKKIKTFLLLLVVTLSFCVGIDYIKAADLPTCDLSQYGTITVTSGGNSKEPDDFVTSDNSGNIYTSHNSMMTGNMVLDDEAKKSKEDTDNNNWWHDGTATITYNIDAGPGGKVSEIMYTFYEDKALSSKGRKVCKTQIPVDSVPDSEVVIVTFKINKGHLKTINLTAKYHAGINDGYVAGGGSGGIDVTVKKGLSKKHKEDMPVNTTGKTTTSTTTASAGCMNPNGTGCNDNEKVISSSKAQTQYITGKGAIMDESNIGGGSTENACNSVNTLFDYFWPYVMIIIPAALIVLIAIDFFKAMSSNDNDAIKKAGTNTVKRTIAAVVLLALPAIVRLIFGLVGLDFCL